MKSSKLIAALALGLLAATGCQSTRPQRTDTWFEIPPYEAYRDAVYDTSAVLALDTAFEESEGSQRLKSRLEALGYRFLSQADKDNAVFKQPDYILTVPCLLCSTEEYKDGVIYGGRCAVIVRKAIGRPDELVEPRTFVAFSRVIATKADVERYREYYLRHYQEITAGKLRAIDETRERAFDQAFDNMVLNPEFRKAIEKK